MSVSSGGSSAGLSQTSSQASAVNHLNKRAKTKNGEDEDEDLLEEKRSFQEFCYLCLDTLTAEKAFTTDWRVNLTKIVLEGLTAFLVVFNPLVQGWDIDYKLWFWQIISWSTYHSAVAVNRDYDVYTNVMYLHVAVVALLILGFGMLALTVNKVQKSKKLKKWVKVLHFCMDVAFQVGFMTFFSVFTFMFNCDFEVNNNGGTDMHLHYHDVDCSQTPHLAHMIVAGVFGALLGIGACVMAIADSEHSPIRRTWLASPAAVTRAKIVVAKMVVIVCTVGINGPRRAPTIIAWLAALYTWWLYFRQMPFYNNWVNIAVSSMWLGVAYTASLLMVLSWDHRNGNPDFHYWMTWNVLKGIFPVIVGGACCHFVFIHYKMYTTRKFIAPPPNVPLRKLHKFEYPEDVEIMSRVMRKFDRDGNVDPGAVEVGDTIIKAGMQYFPNDPGVVLMYASLLLEVRHDGPLTRTQLMHAMKLKPDILEKYKIFVLAQKAKRMKEAADGTMDLQSYVEFKRNYCMLVRVHKEALQNQRDFWKLFFHSKTKDSTVKKALKDLEASSSRAQMVYNKVMERYPNNGKVLKCYGKFLEEVKNDISAATKYYTEGNRLGSTDAIMNMDFDLASKKKSEFLVSMDMHEDAVIIIDAVGTILMISQGTTAMFGYTKIELENANVNMLMPQPFSQRHPSYLQRYTSSGEPHILDKVQEVVALHKDKFVFPVELGVTQLSGTGSDCIFLGVMKALPISMENVRVWVAPSGVVLCADQQFAGLMGYQSEALVGMPIYSLLEDPAAGEAFNEHCKACSNEDFLEHRVVTSARLKGKFLPPVPCNITVKLGGTQTERIFVWNVKRTDRSDEMTMVCDTHGTITFCTWDIAALLGMSTKKLIGTKLDTLLPPPYNSMHAKWLQETPSVVPPNSCRAGVVVNLLNSSHVLVPVRIRVHQIEDQGRTLHVIRVTRASPDAMVAEKRVSLTCTLNGTIEEVEPSVSQLFGWPAEEMKGSHVSDVIDTFANWRQRVAENYYGGDMERCMQESGTGGVKLLLLSFMDQEYARPGGSYRVSVKPPGTDFETALAAAKNTTQQGATLHELLHNAANAAKVRAARPAVMLPEVVEVDGVPAVKVHLYKQDSITGYLEMDTDLNIRKADMWAGLVLGWPSTMLTNQKLHNLLHVPPSCRWEELMGIKVQTGGLKRVNRGTVTAPRSFVASHPDGGTMRITLQGVSKSEGLGTKNRIEATLHPDTSYKGEPSNIFRVLELEGTEEDMAAQQSASRRGSYSGSIAAAAGSRRNSLNWGQGGGGSRRNSGVEGKPGRRGSGGQIADFASMRQMDRTGSGRMLRGIEEAEDEGEGEGGRDEEGGGNQGDEGSQEGSGSKGSKGAEEEEDDMVFGESNDGDYTKLNPPRVSALGGVFQGSDDEDEEDPAKGQKKLKQSDFVAQWVRTIANQTGRPESPASVASDTSASKAKGSRTRPALLAIDEHGNDMVVNEYGEPIELPPEDETGKVSPRKFSTDAKALEHLQKGAKDAERSSSPQAGGSDWERQIADIPDEAGAAEGEKKGKGKRGKRVAADDQPSKPGDEGRSESSAGDGGTEIDGQSVTSGNSAHDEVLIDFRRGRLLKKLVKLVRGPSLAEPLMRLETGTLKVLAAILIVHAVCFAVVITELMDEADKLNTIDRHAKTIRAGEGVKFRVLQAQYCERLISNGTSIPDDNMCSLATDPNAMADEIMEAAEVYSKNHQDIYLGPGDEVRKIPSPKALTLWDEESTSMMMYLDTEPPQKKQEKASVWEFGNRIVYAAREVAYAFRENEPIRDSRHTKFVIQAENDRSALFLKLMKSLLYFTQDTWDAQSEAQTAMIVVLIVQAVAVLTLLHLWQLRLVLDVERARLGNILALISLPGPILRIMHAKPVLILEDDSDDEAEDEEDGEKKLARTEKREEERRFQEAELKRQQGQQEGDGEEDEEKEGGKGSDDEEDEKPGKESGDGGLAIAASKKKREAAPQESSPRRFLQLQSVLLFNGKTLHTSWVRTFKLVLPLFLWQLAVLIVFAVTTQQVSNMHAPLASMFAQMQANSWFTHTRLSALELTSAMTTEGKNKWKEQLVGTDISKLEHEYEIALYGNGEQPSDDVPFPVKPAVFMSEDISDVFFRDKQCFRKEIECLPEDDPYYEATHNGIDAMMRRYLRELKLLAADDPADIGYQSDRMDFIYHVGMYDLEHGLDHAAGVTTQYAISRFSTVQEVHIALLVITVALACGYYYWVIKPYVTYIKREANAVAGLLSHTPKELDTMNHLKGALKVVS